MLGEQLTRLEGQVLALEPSLRREFLAFRKEVARVERDSERLRRGLDRHRRLLERSLPVVAARGAQPIAAELLDALIGLAGASRGFVGLCEGDGWRLCAARSITAEDIVDAEAEVSTSIIDEALRTGERITTADATSERTDQASIQRLRLRSVACVPLRRRGHTLGFVYLDDPGSVALFDAEAVDALDRWLPMVAEHLAHAVDRSTSPFPGFVTRSADLLAELEELARLARFDVPVLLTGPTGTGKSMLASALHRASKRSKGPMVHVNCSALPDALLEGELFGAEPGAYTGARGRRIGKFEAAGGGTLFLDELDTMPISGQVKLLVALQERRVTRLGSNRPVDVDVRVIAATNANPRRAIDEGRLREDLYFRLAKIEVRIPALADRPEDVPLLARHILERSCRRYGLPGMRLTSRALDELCAHRWPGNVRELENVLDRAALLAADRGVIEDVRIARSDDTPTRRTTVDRAEFLRAWTRTGGNVQETGRMLGVSRRSIFRMKKKFLADDAH